MSGLKKLCLPPPQQPVVTRGTSHSTVVQTVARGPETAPEWPRQWFPGRKAERRTHCASPQKFLQISQQSRRAVSAHPCSLATFNLQKQRERCQWRASAITINREDASLPQPCNIELTVEPIRLTGLVISISNWTKGHLLRHVHQSCMFL